MLPTAPEIAGEDPVRTLLRACVTAPRRTPEWRGSEAVRSSSSTIAVLLAPCGSVLQGSCLLESESHSCHRSNRSKASATSPRALRALQGGGAQQQRGGGAADAGAAGARDLPAAGAGAARPRCG